MRLYNQDNFWQMLVYIILLWADHGPLQKNFTKILGINGKKRPINIQPIKTGNEETMGCFLWMDDVVLINTNRNTLQEMLDITYKVASRYRIKFGSQKSKVLTIGKPDNHKTLTIGNTELEETERYILDTNNKTPITILDTNNKTPIAALQIQSGLPTIKEKIHEVQINYYAKKIRTDDTKFIEGTQWEKKINKNLETYNIKKEELENPRQKQSGKSHSEENKHKKNSKSKNKRNNSH